MDKYLRRVKAHYFGSFIDSKASFKKQMDSDKDIAKTELDERIEYREEVSGIIIGVNRLSYLSSSSLIYKEPMRLRTSSTIYSI